MFAEVREAIPGRMFGVALVLIAAVFLAQSLYLAHLVVPSQDESAGLFAGYLAASGRVGLFDDAMPGHRAPAPAYIFGMTQVLSGRSLLAARYLGTAFGVALVLLAGLLARRLAGNLAGLIAAALLTAQGALVGYYSLGDYHSLAPLVLLTGLLVFLGEGGEPRRVAGLAILGSLFFVRTHLWPLIPLALAYGLWHARSRRERVLMIAVVVGPPLVFFLSDLARLKLLVLVPLLGLPVRALGYLPFHELDGRVPLSPGDQLQQLLRLARRYEFLILGTVFAAGWAGWRASRSREPAFWRGDRRVALVAALFLYLFAWLFVVCRINFKWVGMYFASLAPLLSVVLGHVWSAMLRDPGLRRRGRIALAAALAVLLALPVYYNRNPLIPTGALRAADPVRAVRVAGEHLARLVPPDARVFLFGQVDVFYFSGLPATHIQQITNYDTLAVNDADNRATLRSGYYGMTQVERWLGKEDDYAVVSPQGLTIFAEAFHHHPEVNRPKVARIRELLERHFVKIGTVDEYPYYAYDVYRRVSRASDP
ncbi:MAG TPA: hypothetical protein VML54_08180 [Candidatus Limnocylindrales bacterium]|nr:hypothetical protein [Candidatus Limnocylindrales bacterium]